MKSARVRAQEDSRKKKKKKKRKKHKKDQNVDYTRSTQHKREKGSEEFNFALFHHLQTHQTREQGKKNQKKDNNPARDARVAEKTINRD